MYVCMLCVCDVYVCMCVCGGCGFSCRARARARVLGVPKKNKNPTLRMLGTIIFKIAKHIQLFQCFENDFHVFQKMLKMVLGGLPLQNFKKMLRNPNISYFHYKIILAKCPNTVWVLHREKVVLGVVLSCYVVLGSCVVLCCVLS